jgi:hypothetical protein
MFSYSMQLSLIVVGLGTLYEQKINAVASKEIRMLANTAFIPPPAALTKCAVYTNRTLDPDFHRHGEVDSFLPTP